MKGQRLVILHDCFDKIEIENVEFIKVETTENPYFQRWISIYEYLIDKNYDYIFCVDANDVIMLNNPFSHDLGQKLYVGDEKQIVSCRWIKESHDIKDQNYLNFINSYKSKQLLNAGIVGGSLAIVSVFLKKIIDYYNDQNKELGLTDMAAFNFIAYTKFGNVLKHGGKINTEFKKNENISYATQKGIWWKHK